MPHRLNTSKSGDCRLPTFKRLWALMLSVFRAGAEHLLAGTGYSKLSSSYKAEIRP